MTLLRDFISSAVASLSGIYPEREARSIVDRLCEDLLGVRSYVAVVEPLTEVSPEGAARWEKAMARLLAFEPLQYVTGFADFYGRRFAVSPDVLIPRPETELLVREAIAAACRLPAGGTLRILDLCTGSGCIAWSLALERPGTAVTGVDISEKALAVAAGQDFGDELARTGATAPRFIKADVLDIDSAAETLGGPYDIIVSNPPYIAEAQKSQMERNVLDYEPALALFVPDDDPLIFYRAIAALSRRLMRAGSQGFVEINDAFGPQTAALFEAAGFREVRLIPDLAGRDRIVAWKM